MYNVAFPGLGLYFNINNIAFTVLGRNVYWYGIIIAFAIFFCLFLLKKDKNVAVSYEIAEDFILWTLPFAIIGARLYYVIFSWDFYRDNPAEIIKIWNGGLAIYGGIIAAICTAIVFSKIKKIRLFDLLDTCVPYLCLGQAIGRWGNFVNREAYGVAANSIFRMEILDSHGNYISVHPTFLYEFLGLILIFIILKMNKRKFSGEKTAVYLLLYGILRFFVEYLRSDSLMFMGIKISMAVSAILGLAGLLWLIFNYLKYFKYNNK
jgi:phosphatidylglycerol:prolipoprotein diacylglycerol transferase